MFKRSQTEQKKTSAQAFNTAKVSKVDKLCFATSPSAASFDLSTFI